MKSALLFNQVKFGHGFLKNHIVMAPMTRCRATGNLPNNLMEIYYRQRAGAGLIITEGTAPSPNGLGYARIPGIYNEEQIAGWQDITSAVHAHGTKIFAQLMHTGRISHSLNMPAGTRILAPSAIRASGQMWTDEKQMLAYPDPEIMSTEDIQATIADFVRASLNAIRAGFDGIELHAANGYLLEQFLSPHSNIREDDYGGNIQNRCRFIVSITEAVAKAIGKERTGIRLSPYDVANDMSYYPEIDDTYNYLSEQLNDLKIQYIHVVDHASMGAPEVPDTIKKMIRHNFRNTIIFCGGFDKDRAETEVESGHCELVAFGRPFISNPDLVDRMFHNLPFSKNFRADLLYTQGAEGYTDYPLITG